MGQGDDSVRYTDQQTRVAIEWEKTTHVSERGTHDDGVVVMRLVVVEDLLHGLHTRVLVALVGLPSRLLVPVEDLWSHDRISTKIERPPHPERRKKGTHTSDEGRDEGNLGLSTGNGLLKAEEEGKIAVNLMVALELPSSLDTLPSRGDLDQDTLAGDSDGVVEGNEVLSLGDGLVF